MNNLLKKTLIIVLVIVKLVEFTLTLLSEKFGFISNLSNIDGIATFITKTLSYISYYLIFVVIYKFIINKKIEFNKPILFNIYHYMITTAFLYLNIMMSKSYTIISFIFERGLFNSAMFSVKLILFLYILIYFIKNPIQNDANFKFENPKINRFLGLFIDTFIILSIAFQNLRIVALSGGYFFEENEYLNSNPYWFFGLHIFLYYFILELLFLQTVGKMLSNSFVYFESNRTKSILIRTFCRFIPFDAISFFGKKGWHDSLSKTNVMIKNSENLISKNPKI